MLTGFSLDVKWSENSFFFLLFVAIHAALGRKNEKNAPFEGGDVPERSDRKN